MNNLEIDTFLTIVECKTISLAAERLYISQSAVINRLASLEKRIGDRLVVRRKGVKNIELTPRGKEFLVFANRIRAFSRSG